MLIKINWLNRFEMSCFNFLRNEKVNLEVKLFKKSTSN